MGSVAILRVLMSTMFLIPLVDVYLFWSLTSNIFLDIFLVVSRYFFTVLQTDVFFFSGWVVRQLSRTLSDECYVVFLVLIPFQVVVPPSVLVDPCLWYFF